MFIRTYSIFYFNWINNKNAFLQKIPENHFTSPGLIFIASTLLAFYHFGIEEGIFIEPTTCSAGDISKNLSKEELLDQLKQKNISCKDVSFRILGLSLAAINIVISFIFTLVFLKLFLNYKKN